MARAGILLNLASILVIVRANYYPVLVVFGVEPGVVLDWVLRGRG